MAMLVSWSMALVPFIWLCILALFVYRAWAVVVEGKYALSAELEMNCRTVLRTMVGTGSRCQSVRGSLVKVRIGNPI